MAVKIVMPKMGLSMERGTIVRWYKKEGDPIAKGEPLADIETDKILSELESSENGTVLKLLFPESAEVAVLETIAIIGTPGEDVSSVAEAVPAAAESVVEKAEARETAAVAPETAGKGKISPRARKLIAEKALDIAVFERLAVARVSEKDVLRYLEENAAGGNDAGAAELKPLSRVREVIAQNMVESKTKIPHVYYRTTIDADKMIALRAASDYKPSYNDMIVKACAIALGEFPALNASLQGAQAVYHRHCNIGLAVSRDDGLIVPIIAMAERKSLREISAASKTLVEKAKDGTLTSDELAHGTFTVTNLGAFPIDDFCAIIRPTECAILAVGRIANRVVAIDKTMAIVAQCSVTLSADHRLIDGSLAAGFLRRIKELLEAISFAD